MALDSIAKISVLITGDESPLVRAAKRAEEAVRQFSKTMQSESLKWAAQRGINSFGAAVWRGFAAGSSSLADMEKRQVDVITKYNELLIKAGQFRDVVKLPEQSGWGRLKSNLSDGFAAMLSSVKVDEFFNKLADRFEGPSTRSMDAWRKQIADREASLERLTAAHERHEKQKLEFAKQTQDALDAADDRRRQAADDLASRAAQLEESLRTPGEVLKQQLSDIDGMLKSRLILAETYNRAAAEAHQRFADAQKKKDNITRQASQSVAAVERFTSAGFNAVAQAQASTRVQEEQKLIAQQQLNVEQQEVVLLQQISNTLLQLPQTAPYALSRLN